MFCTEGEGQLSEGSKEISKCITWCQFKYFNTGQDFGRGWNLLVHRFLGRCNCVKKNAPKTKLGGLWTCHCCEFGETSKFLRSLYRGKHVCGSWARIVLENSVEGRFNSILNFDWTGKNPCPTLCACKSAHNFTGFLLFPQTKPLVRFYQSLQEPVKAEPRRSSKGCSCISSYICKLFLFLKKFLVFSKQFFCFENFVVCIVQPFFVFSKLFLVLKT